MSGGDGFNDLPRSTRPPVKPLASVCLRDVDPKEVEWLWAGLLMNHAVNLLAGEGGLGKGQVTCHVAAELSRGRLPGTYLDEPVATLFASAEDTKAYALSPRLRAAGADMDYVHAADEPFTLPDDAERLIELALRLDVKLVAIDPVISFLGGKLDSHRDQDARRALDPLQRASEEYGLAFLPVLHLNKADSTDILRRIAHSVAFRNAARSVIVVARDPDDPEGEQGDRRILGHAKANLAKLTRPQAFHIEGAVVLNAEGKPIATQRAVLDGEADVDIDRLLTRQSPEDRSAAEDAREFLRALLADGPVSAKRVKAEAEAAGVAWSTLKRVKRAARVKSDKDGHGGWDWRLLDAEQGTTRGPSINHGSLEPLGSLAREEEVTKGTKGTKGPASHGWVPCEPLARDRAKPKPPPWFTDAAKVTPIRSRQRPGGPTEPRDDAGDRVLDYLRKRGGQATRPTVERNVGAACAVAIPELEALGRVELVPRKGKPPLLRLTAQQTATEAEEADRHA